MINPLYPAHTHILSKWKISLLAQVCIFEEFHPRLNSLLTAMYRFPCICFTTPQKNIKHFSFSVSGFWRQIESSVCLTSGGDNLCSGPAFNILRAPSFPQPYRAVGQQLSATNPLWIHLTSVLFFCLLFQGVIFQMLLYHITEWHVHSHSCAREHYLN